MLMLTQNVYDVIKQLCHVQSQTYWKLIPLFYAAVCCQRQQKQRQLLGRLQDLLLGPKADEQTTCEVLDYFLRRLSSSQVASRVLAVKVNVLFC